MKLKFQALLASALLILSCTCCDRKPKPDDPEEKYLKNATVGDSLIYYFGQLRAYQYEKKAVSDTTKRSKEAREHWLNGLKDGLYAVKQDHPNYNDGLRLGMQLARNLYKFEKNYDVDLSREKLYLSIRKGVMDSVPVDPEYVQTQFYRVLAELNAERDKLDAKQAEENLVEKIKDLGMKKVTPELYMKVIKPGSGPRVKKGDRIYASINYTNIQGEGLGMPSPEFLTVGEGDMPPVLVRAYTLLRKGEAATFATTSHALFGTRGDLIGLKPKDVVLIHVTLTDVESPARSNPYDKALDSLTTAPTKK